MADEEVLDTPEQTEKLAIKDSILLLIKKKLGITPDYHAFDEDVITAINSTLMIVNQLGVGKEGFVIEDEKALWTDFLGEDKSMEAVKDYIFIKVKLLFDPPTSSFVITALEKQASEYEFRLNVIAEQKLHTSGGVNDGE